MTADPCPICSKPSEAKYAPFCSRRCADIDLSRWLKGAYAIPGKPAGEEDENTRETAPNPSENDGSERPDQPSGQGIPVSLYIPPRRKAGTPR